MKIINVLGTAGISGFFFDDQKAIKAGAKADGDTYVGKPVTAGFEAVRMKGESICVMIELEDGQIAFGDCAAVQYSGTGGRDPLFCAKDYLPVLNNLIAPLLIGRQLGSFKELATFIDNLKDSNGNRIHTALRYGLTQALLDATAKSQHMLMAEVVAKEYNTGGVGKVPLRVFTQSGDNRYNNVDKMIIKRAATLPHGLINNVEMKLGKNGEKLLEYVVWLKNRTRELGGKNYLPNLHIDVYGTIGIIFNNDLEKIAQYLEKVEKAASPLNIYIEGPIDLGERTKQMEGLRDLRKVLEKKKCSVKIVADEWCNTLEDVIYFTDNKAGHMVQIKTPDLGGINNTIEAVLYCKKHGMEAYQGGTCNETNLSAEICVHLAMATKPELILAKPGMGVDEGLMITNNEMQRILVLAHR